MPAAFTAATHTEVIQGVHQTGDGVLRNVTSNIGGVSRRLASGAPRNHITGDLAATVIFGSGPTQDQRAVTRRRSEIANKTRSNRWVTGGLVGPVALAVIAHRSDTECVRRHPW